MALDTAFYLVTRDIAIRSGLVGKRYRTKDGRYVLDNKDLSRIRFTTDEYINGLNGVEKITEAQAASLIAEAGYDRTYDDSAGATETTQTPTENVEAPAAEEPAAAETPTEDAETLEESSDEKAEEDTTTEEQEETNEGKEVDDELDK
jgi:hypothetical protein